MDICILNYRQQLSVITIIHIFETVKPLFIVLIAPIHKNRYNMKETYIYERGVLCNMV